VKTSAQPWLGRVLLLLLLLLPSRRRICAAGRGATAHDTETLRKRPSIVQ